MKFHPLKYDFLRKNWEYREIPVKKEELDIARTVPLFYVERNEKKHYFGNIYKHDNAYYFLLPFKFEHTNSFYGYKMCKMFINESSKSKLEFYNDYGGLNAHFDIQRNLLFNVFDEGQYLGNLYLHDIKDIIKRMKDDFGKSITKPKIEKILNEHSGYNQNTYKKVIAEMVNYVDLYFDDEVLNLNKYDDWEKLFDYKDKDFQMKIQLMNGYAIGVEGELNGLYKKNNLSYGLEKDNDWIDFTKNLKTGSLVIGQYSSNKLLKHLNDLSKEGILTYSLNSIQSISFSLEERINHINYFKDLILIIDDSGYPALKSLHDDAYCFKRPFVNVYGNHYKVINYSKENEKIYNEHLLKLI